MKSLGNYKFYRLLIFLLKDLRLSLFFRKKAYYFQSVANFGDAMNKELISFLTNDKVKFISSTEFFNIKNILVIGSVIQISNKNSIVWGSGLHFNSSKFFYHPPKKVLAVRGPKTRQRLIELGVTCPEVYGDPALLLPGVFNPKIKKEFLIGIIPHYLNQNDKSLHKYRYNKSIKIIDVKQEPLEVVKAILSCKVIVSSSLHGLIISDAYNIPNIWTEFGSPIGKDHFKFHDYFLSINRKIVEPVNFQELDIDNLSEAKSYNHGISFNPEPLLNNSPFSISSNIKSKIVNYYKNSINNES